MAVNTEVRTVHEIGRAFAEAYARADIAGIEELLHPEVHYRELTPRKSVDSTGVEPIVDEVREFLGGYDGHETVEISSGQVGTRAWARTRWLLKDGTTSAVVDWCQYMDVAEGRIRSLWLVCSGPMPV